MLEERARVENGLESYLNLDDILNHNKRKFILRLKSIEKGLGKVDAMVIEFYIFQQNICWN